MTFDTNVLSSAARLDGLLDWVVADLAASTARWKVVYGHHPLAGVPDKSESPAGNYYQQVVNRLKAAATSLKVDADNPTGTSQRTQALLRFDSLFGDGPGRIPANAVLRSATLTLHVTNGGDTMNLHRMAADWSPSATWNSFGDGIQANGVEAVAFADTSSGRSETGAFAFNVAASLRAWQTTPASNHGWVVLPTGADGVDFGSAESAANHLASVGMPPQTTARGVSPPARMAAGCGCSTPTETCSSTTRASGCRVRGGPVTLSHRRASPWPAHRSTCATRVRGESTSTTPQRPGSSARRGRRGRSPCEVAMPIRRISPRTVARSGS